MQKTTTMFVGLDFHEAQIAVVWAARNPGAEALLLGQSGELLNCCLASKKFAC